MVLNIFAFLTCSTMLMAGQTQMPASSLATGEADSAAPRRLTGTVSDARCDAHHMAEDKSFGVWTRSTLVWHSLLSPLRLPVPPSRLFVEVLDFTAYFAFYVFFIQDNDCETVQVNVEVFMDFHRSLSPAGEVLCGSSRATMSPGQAITRTSVRDVYHPTQS